MIIINTAFVIVYDCLFCIFDYFKQERKKKISKQKLVHSRVLFLSQEKGKHIEQSILKSESSE